jgi:glycosyltransferase involved in cell wall biosynthesis
MTEKWAVSIDDLNFNNRNQGISGFIRARNEEEWLGLSIESHLPFLDEIVVVYNRCIDATPEIALDYQKRYPDKVKVYNYEPDVYPQGSKEVVSLPENSPNSLINYYNYALCKTTKKIALKVDGDQIAIPKVYSRMISFVKKHKSFPYYYKFRGINLYDYNNDIFIQGYKQITGLDRGFFEVNKLTLPWHVPDRDRGLEILSFTNIKSKNSNEIGFFHTKGMKKDKGKGNYDLENNPSSRYHNIFKKEWQNSIPIKWEDFITKSKLKDIPHPTSLGIYPLNER